MVDPHRAVALGLNEGVCEGDAVTVPKTTSARWRTHRHAEQSIHAGTAYFDARDERNAADRSARGIHRNEAPSGRGAIELSTLVSAPANRRSDGAGGGGESIGADLLRT
jgi:hypothetical protein